MGSSYDNALAESVIGLYKTELVKPRRPWKGLDDLEIATAEWVDWFNHRRPLEYCDDPHTRRGRARSLRSPPGSGNRWILKLEGLRTRRGGSDCA